MAEAEPVEKLSNAGTMDDDAASGKIEAKRVERQVAVFSHARRHEGVMIRELPATDMPLASW